MITEETLLLKAQGFSILALGDFNTRVGQMSGLQDNLPDTNKNFPMFLNFIKCTNLVILNTLPVSKGLFTRFMDGSDRSGTKSLLDYGLRDAESVHTVSSFIIDSDARFDCGTDHALLEVDLIFSSKTSIHWNVREALHFNISDGTDFTKYSDNLDTLISSIVPDNFSSLSTEQMLVHISSIIRQAGMETFGLKLKRRKKREQRLPTVVLEMIKNKNQLSRRLREAYLANDNYLINKYQKNIDSIKTELKIQICKIKLKRRHRIRSKLLRDDPTRKKFWSFLKNQMLAAGYLSSCYDKDGKIVFDQQEIEGAVLDHFGGIFKGNSCILFKFFK